MNAPVQQQPLVKAAQAAQLPRRRTRVNAMFPQVLEKCRHILLRGRQQHSLAALNKLRKCLQVAHRRPHR